MGQSSAEAKARYRDRNREAIRAKGRAYAARRRRELGQPALGAAESRANRATARKAIGGEHGNWTGDDASYAALHLWLHRHKPRTGTCEWCGEAPTPSGRKKNGTHFANLSGEYRRDVDDYAELCPTCHVRFDRGLIDPPAEQEAA